MEITEGAFADLDIMKLNDVFLSYHLAMESAMMVGGWNNYNLQHIGKSKLCREVRLPIAIRCSNESLEIADAHLHGDTERVVRVIEDGMDDLGKSMGHLFLSDEDSTYAAVNVDDLVAITEGAFADLDIMKLNDVFISYHLAM